MSASVHQRLELDDEELQRITKRTQPAAQARFLRRMNVHFVRRMDGSLLVGRAAMERAMLGTLPQGVKADDPGIQWKVAQ